MADEEYIFILTDSDGFSHELSPRFRPESYFPSTGGQSALYRAYRSDKVVQTSDTKGNPQPIRLKGYLDVPAEKDLMDLLEEYTKMVTKAVTLTRTGASWPSWTLIKGANYIEPEVQPKANRLYLTLVLVPDKISNATVIWGGP